MMEKANTTRKLELLIPDYLNGHVTVEQRNAIEVAIARDSEFKRIVDAERSLFGRVKSRDLTTNAQPDFNVLEQKIDKRFGRWTSRALPWSVPAAFAMVLVVGLANWSNNNIAFNDFETLSTASTIESSAALRVIGSEKTSYEDFLLLFATYDVSVVQQIESLRVFDINPPKGQSVEQLEQILKKDERIRSVRLIEEGK